MKKILIIISVLFSAVACSENSSLLEPENTLAEESFLPKGRPILNSKLDDGDLFFLYDSLSWGENIKSDDRIYFTFEKVVDEDESDYPQFKHKYSKNFTVNGNKGAVLFVRKSWFNKEHKKVSLTALLRIPRDAYEGDLTFEMIFDLENYALELYPSPFSFNIPVILDMTFRNINIPQDLNVDFTYLDGDEKMDYNYVKCSSDKGSLVVRGAELHHFSRYGWTRSAR